MMAEITTTYAPSAYHHLRYDSNPVHDKAYSIQHYVVKVISDLRQVGGFLRVLRFPLPTKLISTLLLTYS
jgi:hypothetical protein